MPYKVDFNGLVCFAKEEGGARLALLPDGRKPGRGVDPHFPEIIVAADAIVGGDGWTSGLNIINGRLHIALDKSTIEISDADQSPAVLDARNLKVPRLNDVDPHFDVDRQNPNAVVKMRIGRGRLASYRTPGIEAVNAAIISQLEVQHDGPITLTVTPGTNGRATGPTRTLTLRAGTEIMISNMSRPGERERVVDNLTGRRIDENHFLIYESLATRKVNLAGLEAELSSRDLPVLPTKHPLFTAAGPIGTGLGCGNTGCC